MFNSSKKISTVFMGTSGFAVPILESLLKIDYLSLNTIITQPDKKVGRKKILTPPPVKIFLLEAKLPIGSLASILQPINIKDPKILKQLQTINPQLIIVAAYGQILPREIIKMPKYGCINIHASLLPKYRGASPIQTAILNGDQETGVTIIKMDKGVDTGDIISQEKIKISHNDTAQTLHNKLAKLGAELLVKTLPDYIRGKIKLIPQDSKQYSRISPTKILTRKDGEIDWGKSAIEIERMLRAFTPWPGIYTFFKGKKLKILEVAITPQPPLSKGLDDVAVVSPLIRVVKTGQLYEAKGKLLVNCSDGALILEKVQPEGKKIMTGQEFINGYLK
jgi:methionyl-tRNA formyltransferase